MYNLSEEQIAYILEDIKKRGIETEDLQNNLLDHLCCCIENELEENGDFHSFYSTLIKRFYKTSLSELEEETQSLLIFKNYYSMKKVMLGSGITSAILLVTGIIFKFNHLAGASFMLVVGVFFLSLIFLPLMFILKIRENDNKRDKVLTFLAAIAAITMSLAPLFKIMYWPGANMLAVVALFTLIALFLPIYFYTGIRKQETKVNTIISTVLIIGASGLFLALARSPYASHRDKKRQTIRYFHNNEIYQHEKALIPTQDQNNPIVVLSNQIDSLCELLKSGIVRDQTGLSQLTLNDIENDKLIGDFPAKAYLSFEIVDRQVNQLRTFAKAYNERVTSNKNQLLVPDPLNILANTKDRMDVVLNDLIQIQMIVLQNQEKPIRQ